MTETTVTTPNELEIGVERIFDAPPTHVDSVLTDPGLIPEWWGDGTVVEEMDVRRGGTYRFRTAYGVVEGQVPRGRAHPRGSCRRSRITCSKHAAARRRRPRRGDSHIRADPQPEVLRGTEGSDDPSRRQRHQRAPGGGRGLAPHS